MGEEEHESNNSKLTPSDSNIFLYFKGKTQRTGTESPNQVVDCWKRERERWVDWQFSPDTQKVTPQPGPAS